MRYAPRSRRPADTRPPRGTDARVARFHPRRPTLAAQVPTLVLAFCIPAALALLNVGFSVVLTQLLLVGPCLAAIANRTRVIAVNTVYVLAVMTWLAVPNQTWGKPQQLATTLGGVAVGLSCMALARRREQLERSSALVEGGRTILAGIVESSVESMIGLLLDGTIITWNRGAERLYGYPASAVLGRNVEVLYPPEPQPPMREIRARVAAGESVDAHDVPQIHADGSTLELAITISPIRDPAGAIIGAASLARDLAPVKRAERQQAALEHQSQRAASLARLAGGIAHDFNNLLAVIGSSAEFIEDEADDPDAVRADARQVRIAAERAAGLTRQLLQFAGGQALPGAEIDLEALVVDLSEVLARTAGEDIQIVFQASGTAPRVLVNPGRIEQVLHSLVVNARDAMPDGGTIVLATEVLADGDEPLSDEPSDPRSDGPVDRPPAAPPTFVAGSGIAEWTTNDPGNEGRVGELVGPRVRLSVTDSGLGMTPEVAEQVFEPFFTTKSLGGGAGLGLSSVYGIVTEAHGQIGVSTAPGAGTTVWIDFPLIGQGVTEQEAEHLDPQPAGPTRDQAGDRSGESAAAPSGRQPDLHTDDGPGQPVEGPEPARPPTRVLLVDDQQQIRDVVARLLRRAGYEVLATDSGATGIELGTEHRIDLLVTDVLMPGISGRELAVTLRARQPDLPILFMSGYSDSLLDLRGADTTADVIPKPFTERELLDRVAKALERAPAAAAPLARSSPAA